MFGITPTKRQLRSALRELADAVALTLPGSAWTDEIDEALLEATAVIGPMEGESLLEAAERRADREFEAYQQGCDQTEAEYFDALEAKSAFIDEQAALIGALIEANVIDWARLPEDLRNRLADYV